MIEVSVRLIRVFLHRARSLFQRSRQEDELDREIALHVEQLVKQFMADGMDEREARLEAKREFGRIDATKEDCRDMRRMGLAEDLLRDIWFAFRLFRKSPGFTLTAVLSLTLGIGANSALFQLFDAVRLRLLPVERPHELVALRIIGEGRSGNFRGRNGQATNAVWEEVKRRQHGLAGVFAYGDTPLNLAASGELRNVEGLWVSGSFFPVLGVRAQMGRLLTPQDDRPGCGWQGVVISHGFWQREFGGDPDVLARTLPIDGHAVPILGVTPPTFFGIEVGRRFDVAMPICSASATDLNNRMFWFLSMMGRLPSGESKETARAGLRAISAGVFAATTPPFSPGHQALYAKLQLDLAPASAGQSGFREGFQGPLAFLLSMVMFVLLLACANLANMMLARATAREHEFAIRASLGASRWRLIRQVLLESMLLATMGAAAGAIVAPLVSGRIVAMLSTSRDPIFLVLDRDWRMLGFTIAVAFAATVLFGIAPALRAARADARGASASREKLGFRQALLIVQVALSMVLLTAALLFSQSFRNLLTAQTGFQQRGVLVMSTFFRADEHPPERRRLMIDDLHRALTAIPGVSGVARAYVIPISGSGWDRGARVNPTDQPQEVDLNSISEGYFRVMNTPLLAGRDFNAGDRPTSTPVAIVNQAFAKRFFHGDNPVGKTFRLDSLNVNEPPYEIVGLVGNAKYTQLAEEFGPIAYFAASQETSPRTTVRYVMRATGLPQSLMTPAKEAVARVDPRLTLRFVVLAAQIEESVLPQRLMALLTAAFGALGAMLALTGVFGVTAYVVARRYREFGVRVALGATGAGIIRLVLGELTVVLITGLTIGGALAVAAGSVASKLLYGVKAFDALTLLVVITLLTTGGLIAGLIPALRASRVAPSSALRID